MALTSQDFHPRINAEGALSIAMDVNLDGIISLNTGQSSRATSKRTTTTHSRPIVVDKLPFDDLTISCVWWTGRASAIHLNNAIFTEEVANVVFIPEPRQIIVLSVHRRIHPELPTTNVFPKVTMNMEHVRMSTAICQSTSYYIANNRWRTHMADLGLGPSDR